MKYPLNRDTIVALGCMSLLLVPMFAMAPVVAITFEVGLLVGAILHSSHVTSGELLNQPADNTLVTDGGDDKNL